MKHTAPFTDLSLRHELLDNLATLGYVDMTPIQVESLPFMLKGDDVIGQAQTGTGKTAAFALTILQHLKPEHYAVQALVLCPTRELADQVCQVMRQLARLIPNIKVLNLSGGSPMKIQLDSLNHSAHIIVGTPGRVLKHLQQASLSLFHLKTLVLDEADRMLDMGFYDPIKEIIQHCPKERQTLLFSATYPSGVKELAAQFMKSPKKITIEAKQESDIEQIFYEVENQNKKLPLLQALLQHYQPESTLIFCNTKDQTSDVVKELKRYGFHALALNGDLEQLERDEAVIQFANQSCNILVATDVAARGLDIKELAAVINYDLAFEHDVHTHRIGRTARAGCKGLALSITTPADGQRLCAIEDDMNKPLSWGARSDLAENAVKKPARPSMVTLCLKAGKKDKMRPGDILGALTKDAGLDAALIGKINITNLYSYVAVNHSIASKAYQHFQHGKLKGRKIHVVKL